MGQTRLRHMCPLSGIYCDQCGYFAKTRECFLASLLETLDMVSTTISNIGE